MSPARYWLSGMEPELLANSERLVDVNEQAGSTAKANSYTPVSKVWY
jgi:hypothetical protein